MNILPLCCIVFGIAKFSCKSCWNSMFAQLIYFIQKISSKFNHKFWEKNILETLYQETLDWPPGMKNVWLSLFSLHKKSWNITVVCLHLFSFYLCRTLKSIDWLIRKLKYMCEDRSRISIKSWHFAISLDSIWWRFCKWLDLVLVVFLVLPGNSLMKYENYLQREKTISFLLLEVSEYSLLWLTILIQAFP